MEDSCARRMNAVFSPKLSRAVVLSPRLKRSRFLPSSSTLLARNWLQCLLTRDQLQEGAISLRLLAVCLPFGR